MTKRSTARTTLTISDELVAAFAELGVPANAFPEIIKREQAKRTSQEDFTKGLEEELEKGRAARAEAKAANEKAEADRLAEERKVNRLALAGMAMQGLLSGTTAWAFDGVARQAVSYADALLDALEA